MSRITLAEILNVLQDQEQRGLVRQEGSVDGAFEAMHKVEKQCNNNSSNTGTFPLVSILQKDQSPPTKKVLVEARYKMSESNGPYGKGMQISTAVRRSHDRR